MQLAAAPRRLDPLMAEARSANGGGQIRQWITPFQAKGETYAFLVLVSSHSCGAYSAPGTRGRSGVNPAIAAPDRETTPRGDAASGERTLQVARQRPSPLSSVHRRQGGACRPGTADVRGGEWRRHSGHAGGGGR